jgi:two-component system CheB/CheR fusion protein
MPLHDSFELHRSPSWPPIPTPPSLRTPTPLPPPEDRSVPNEDRAVPAGDAGPDGSADGPTPIVGIGASADGVDALRRFFAELPEPQAKTHGMAFVVLPHLAPDRESTLTARLQQATALPVETAADGAAVEPGHVYVRPPGRRLSIAEGHLQVTRSEERPASATIDRFFRALAADQDANAVGIVLSGTGTDGSVGLRALREAGGVTMVQAPTEAEYDSMPQSALATGLVDLALPVEELAARLVDRARER